MSSFDKLIQKIFAGGQVSYSDAETLLLKLGYRLSISGSHHGFRKPDCETITLKRRSQLFPYQLKLLQEVLKQHGYKKN